MGDIDAAITALAARQHGLVNQRQLLELGSDEDLARRRRRAGQWRAAGRGVFVVGAAPGTFRQRIMAAQLAAGDGAMVSHRTAGRLWEPAGRRPIPIDVSIPHGRSFRRQGVITHVSRDLDLAAPTLIDGIRVTGLARTLLDLGAVAPDEVRQAVWSAPLAALAYQVARLRLTTCVA